MSRKRLPDVLNAPYFHRGSHDDLPCPISVLGALLVATLFRLALFAFFLVDARQL
jgi:hypothetical protein